MNEGLTLLIACTSKWHVFYIRNRHISVSSFVYKYDQWPHDSYMTGRAGVWEADDIVKFLLKFAFKDVSTKNSEPTYWTILFVMLKIYFIYKVAGKKSRRAI
jgi:hypothetical protein